MTAETLYRWVKASERLPEKNGDIAIRIDGVGYSGGNFCLGRIFVDHWHDWADNDFLIGRIEWLEEHKASATLPVNELDVATECVLFADWLQQKDVTTDGSFWTFLEGDDRLYLSTTDLVAHYRIECLKKGGKNEL